MTKYDLIIISTYSVLLPVLAGIIVFKKAGVQFRLLLFLLIFGFISDFFIGRLYNSGEEYYSRFVFNVYSPVEAAMFSWLIFQTGYSKIIKQLAFWGIIIWPLVWIFLNIDFKTFHWVDTLYNPKFVSAYEIVIASLSTACILNLTTNGEPLLLQSLFWLLLGIFIYCFCTFFVNALAQTHVMPEIWYLHNTINIITCLIFTAAFFVVGKTAQQ